MKTKRIAGQTGIEKQERTSQNSTDVSWFNQARYGMFIHWGPFSVGGRGEWLMNRERIPQEEYGKRFVDPFLAEKFDPQSWVDLAREAGMKYMVLTTRHHDGFCLWDTKTQANWKATVRGPKRDLVREYVEAVRSAGIKVGLYYSVTDWTHPNYPGAFFRDWPEGWPDERARKRFVAFYHAQLEELMKDYGKIDLLWYDGGLPKPLDGSVINRRIKEWQPDILINNRNGEPFDFQCCEQAIRPPKPGIPWEACMTLNDSWGFHAADHNWKPAGKVAQMLIETASQGGNLLLNVGPRADGVIPRESLNILREVGQWLKKNDEFLADSERNRFSWLHGGRIGVKGNTIYLLLFCHGGGEVCTGEVANRVKRVRLLDPPRELKFRQEGERLFIKDIPATEPGVLALTVAIEVEGKPEPINPQKNSWIPD
jgi:alpha-L-fucosidase